MDIIKFIEKHKNDFFVIINIYDNVVDSVQKCEIKSYNKEITVQPPFGRGYYSLDIERYDLKPFGLIRNYGDEGHYGKEYIIPLTEKGYDTITDILYENSSHHRKCIEKNDLYLNLLYI